MAQAVKNLPALPPRQPVKNNSQGSGLPRGRGPQEGPQGREQAEARCRRRGHLTKHTKFVRNMTWEACGFAPYERRARELLMVSKDKRALKLIKKRVGTRIHAKMKRGAERRLSHHEERSSQKGLKLSPPNTVNLSRKKKKESDCNTIDLGSIPGWGRSPGEGNGNPLQYSRLGNSMDRGGWRVAVHRVAKSRP